MAESWQMHNEGSVAYGVHVAADAPFGQGAAWQDACVRVTHNNLERSAAFTKPEVDSSLPGYPRIITAMELLEESDDESTFCGPQSDSEDSGLADIRALEAWGIGLGADDEKATGPDVRSRDNGRGADGGGPARGRQPREPRRQPAGDGDSRQPREQAEPPPQRRPPPLVAPRGEVIGDNQKFICVFQIGLEDNEEFCLVKRILGKAGNNMRRIAEECSAKVRLRGIGSGFLEGADGKEANMPLQLNVSCTDYDSYLGAVERVSTLLKDLYKHYRRYARSKGMEPPDVKINLEEVRRDDLNLDLLSQKAQRSPSQRERDRRARDRERQQLRERERERERERGVCTPSAGGPARDGLGASELASKNEHRVENASMADSEFINDGSRPPSDGECEAEKDGGGSKGKTPLLLPGGMQVPTTPAGRRAAARAGGAAAAAIASAAAREAERVERDRLREERNRQRDQDREEREQRRREAAAAASSRNSRNNARGKAKAGQHPVGSAPDRAYTGPQEGKGKSSYGAQSTKGGGSFGKGKGKGTNKGGPPPPPPGPPPDDALQYSPAQ